MFGGKNKQARVAQWLEHWSYEPRVGGSIPPSSISFIAGTILGFIIRFVVVVF